jgi:hypothetical protein
MRAWQHERVSDRTSGFALSGQGPQHLLHPFAQVVEQRRGPRLTDGESQIGRLAADLIFDPVERTQSWPVTPWFWRGVDGVDLVELAPCVCPAGDLIDGAIAVQMMEAGVGVCLKAALGVLQMSPWMLALAILRVREPDRWREIFARGFVVAHIGPKPGRSGLATARRKHRDRRVVGVKRRESCAVLDWSQDSASAQRFLSRCVCLAGLGNDSMVALPSPSVRWPQGTRPSDTNDVFDTRAYLRQPGYGTSYVSGKLMLDRLTTEYSHQQDLASKPFVLRDFLDGFNQEGMIPVSLMETEMVQRTHASLRSEA